MNTRVFILFLFAIFMSVSPTFAQWTQVSGISSNVVSLAITPNGNLFVGTSSDGLFRSTTGGSSWELVLGNGSGVYQVYSLAFDPSGNVYAGTSGEGVFMSTDAGHAWGNFNDLPLEDIHAVAANSSGRVFATYYGSVYYSTNAGTNWNEAKHSSNRPSGGYRSIACPGASTVYACGTVDWFCASTDNGSSWTWTGSGTGLNKQPLVNAVNSLGTVFVGTVGGGVFKSTDGGGHWASCGLTATTVNALAIQPGDVVLAGTSSGVFISRDNGSTWTQYNSGLTHTDIRSFAFDASGNAYAGAYTSTNSGGLWRSNTPLPIQLTSFTGRVSGTAIFLQWNTLSEVDNYGFQVERSAQAIGGYQTVSGLIPGHGTTNVPQSYVFTDRTVLAVGSYYYRLENIDLNSTVHYSDPVKVEIKSGSQGQALPESFELQTNYPNPFNPTTQIGYALPVSSWVTLKVFDALGREVSTLVDQAKSEGSHFAEFNGSALPSGSYYYRIFAHPLSGAKTAEFTATKKLLLIR